MSLFENPIIDRPHKYGGIQKIYRFPNNHGASVIRSLMPGLSDLMYGSYTNDESEWELAIIKFKSEDNEDFILEYSTGITEDVLGHLQQNEVEEILERIKNLPCDFISVK